MTDSLLDVKTCKSGISGRWLFIIEVQDFGSYTVQTLFLLSLCESLLRS